MITNASYYQNKSVFIPGSVVNPNIGGNTPNLATQLIQEIDSREYEALLSFLGLDQVTVLWAQFVPETGAWIEDALQKWKDLVDGKGNWRGLRYTVGTKKLSLLAFYVFFYYLKDDFSNYSSTGIQVPEAENSIRQDPNGKQAQAWNSFVTMAGGSRCVTSYSFFRNWNGLGMQWGADRNNNAVTLYQFLQDNNDVYDCSFFTIPNSGIGSVINSWNL